MVGRCDPEHVASVRGGDQVEVGVGRFWVHEEAGHRAVRTTQFDGLVAVLFPLPGGVGRGCESQGKQGGENESVGQGFRGGWALRRSRRFPAPSATWPIAGFLAVKIHDGGEAGSISDFLPLATDLMSQGGNQIAMGFFIDSYPNEGRLLACLN